MADCTDQPSVCLPATSRAIVALAGGPAGWLWVTMWEGWGKLVYEYLEPETQPLLLPMEAVVLSLLFLGDSSAAKDDARDVALCSTFAQILALMQHARPIKPEMSLVVGGTDGSHWEYRNPQVRLPCWMDPITVLYRSISHRSRFPKSFAYIGLTPPVGAVKMSECQQLAVGALENRELDIFLTVLRLAPEQVLCGSMPPKEGEFDMTCVSGALVMFSAACTSQLFARVVPLYSFRSFLVRDFSHPAAAGGSVGVAIPDVSALEYVFHCYEGHEAALEAAVEKLQQELQYVATFPRSLAFALDRIRIDALEIAEVVKLCATDRRKYPRASLAVFMEHPRTADIASSMLLPHEPK